MHGGSRMTIDPGGWGGGLSWGVAKFNIVGTCFITYFVASSGDDVVHGDSQNHFVGYVRVAWISPSQARQKAKGGT